MANIFISSSFGNPEDDRFLKRIAKGLSDRGHTLIGPASSPKIELGADLRDTLKKQLISADAVVVLLSDSATKSKWVHWEIGFVSAIAEKTGKPLIIPFIIGGGSFRDVPDELASRMWFKPKDPEDAIEKIEETLGAHTAIEILEQEKRAKSQERVKETAAEYIETSLEELRSRESKYQFMSVFWYSLGYISLVLGVGVAMWRLFIGNASSGLDWPAYAQFVTLSIVAIGLLVATSRYSFILGKSNAVEALRNSDRVHAIKFGHFFLNAFGENATWNEVKEAFQHWNIDSGSVFADQKPSEIDANILEALRILGELSKRGKKS